MGDLFISGVIGPPSVTILICTSGTHSQAGLARCYKSEIKILRCFDSLVQNFFLHRKIFDNCIHPPVKTLVTSCCHSESLRWDGRASYLRFSNSWRYQLGSYIEFPDFMNIAPLCLLFSQKNKTVEIWIS